MEAGCGRGMEVGRDGSREGGMEAGSGRGVEVGRYGSREGLRQGGREGERR